MADARFTTLQPGLQLSLAEGIHRGQLERAGHTGTAIGDHVYIIGGRRGSRFYTDLLRLDLKSRQWEKVFNQLPFSPRANHIAVAAGHNIWVFGGADNKDVHADVWILDTKTLSWHPPQLSGTPQLLARCAAGADLVPSHGNCIMVCGGYGYRNPESIHFDYFNDVVKIDTQRMRVDLVRTSGVPPSPRCFHTFTNVGNRCYMLGGRRLEQGEGREKDLIGVFDCTTSSWVDFEINGGSPPPRSSHRALSLGDRLIVTGGIIGDGTEKNTDADLVVTLRTGDDLAPVAQLQWSTQDQPHRSLSYDWPQGRGGHACCLVRNQVLLLLGYTGKEHRIYLPDVLMFEVALPKRLRHSPSPQPPISPTSHVPITTCPGPLVSPVRGTPDAKAAPIVHVLHHRSTRQVTTTDHVPSTPLKGAAQDEYNIDNLDPTDNEAEAARNIRAGPSRLGAHAPAHAQPAAAAAAADAAADGKRHRARDKGGGVAPKGRGAPKSPQRPNGDMAAGSPGEGGWRLSKSAALAPSQAHDVALMDSEPWAANKRQRTGRSPGADGRRGPEHLRSGAGASPADVGALAQPAAPARGRAPAEGQAQKGGTGGRRSPGRSSSQVERLQADVQRLQEELKRARNSESAAKEQAMSFNNALNIQRSSHESECNRLHAKLAERDAMLQSKSSELMSTQQAYGEAVRQTKEHQRQLEQVVHEKRELIAENSRIDQEYTLMSKRLNEYEVKSANAEAKVSSLEIEVRRAKNEAHAAIDDIMVQLRQKQASYDKMQSSYDTLTVHQAKSAARVAELQELLIQQQNEASEAKRKAVEQLVQVNLQRDTERHAAEAAKQELKLLQQKNGTLEHSLARQTAAVEDLQRRLSAATTELTQVKASLRSAQQELSTLKSKHEQLVKAGVEIAQDLRGSLEQALHARDRSAVFEEEDARIQAQERHAQQQAQARAQAQQMLEEERQAQRAQQAQQAAHAQQRAQQAAQQAASQGTTNVLQQPQQLQQSSPLQQTELQCPQLPPGLGPPPLPPLPAQPSSPHHDGSSLGALGGSGTSILGPPPQICGCAVPVSGAAGPSNAVT